MVADLLVSLGHRRIAAFSHTFYDNTDSVRRVELLREFLAAYNVDIPDKWVLNTKDDKDTYPERDLNRILAEPEPPTVIFCWHDRLGYRVLEHCARLDIDVPGDVSIIGYDCIRWPSRSGHELASVDVDIPSIAHAAVHVLHERIGNAAFNPETHLVPVRISMGTTLGPPKG